MAGKKKDMDGGTFGFNPSYENKSINDIAHKIINGKKNEDKMEGFKWLNTNYLRAEQRIDAFFKKLHEELRNNLDEFRIEKLSDWFKKIINKYPDKIEEIIKEEIQQRKEGPFYFAYNFFKTKYPLYNFTDKPQLLKYLQQNKKKEKSPVNFKPQAQNSPDNFTPQAQNYNLLIDELNKLYKKLYINNNKGLRKLANEEKEELSIVISNLAQKIYDKAIHVKRGPEFTHLHLELYKLYDIYRVYFIDEFRKYGQNLKNVEGVANNKKTIALNLQKKENTLKKIVSN